MPTTSWDTTQPDDTDLQKDFPLQHRTEKSNMGTLLGIPSATSIGSPLFETDANGLKTIVFQNAAADPSAAGQVRRNGATLRFHNGTVVVSLLDSSIPTTLRDQMFS